MKSDNVQKAIRKHKTGRRWLAPLGALALRSFMMFLVLGSTLFGAAFLWQKALSDPRFRLDGETLALAGAIREVPESVAELEAIGKSFNGRSLLDPWLITDMQNAYGKNRWIRQITRIRRNFPNRVSLLFLLRMPAAQVWHQNRFWLVDDEAALLPVEGSTKPFAALPEIVGVTPGVINSKPEVGAVWHDDGVAGALGIIRCFWGSPLGETLPVERVVVSSGVFRDAENRDRRTRRRFDVVAANGAVVRWGTYNPDDLEGELTSSEKLWNLQELLRREESLATGVCFDVRTRLPGFTLVQDQ